MGALKESEETFVSDALSKLGIDAGTVATARATQQQLQQLEPRLVKAAERGYGTYDDFKFLAVVLGFDVDGAAEWLMGMLQNLAATVLLHLGAPAHVVELVREADLDAEEQSQLESILPALSDLLLL